MTGAQAIGFLRRELAAGGTRRARALPVVRRIEAAYQQYTARLHAAQSARRSTPVGSGTDLAGALNSPIGKAIESSLGPVGQVAAQIVSFIAPVLDTSLQNVQCAPGNPNYPACSIPGGSIAAMMAPIGPNDPGLSLAAADAIVAARPQGGPSSVLSQDRTMTTAGRVF